MDEYAIKRDKMRRFVCPACEKQLRSISGLRMHFEAEPDKLHALTAHCFWSNTFSFKPPQTGEPQWTDREAIDYIMAMRTTKRNNPFDD